MGKELNFRFSPQARKFLESLPTNQQDKVREKLKFIDKGFRENLSALKPLNIKALKGRWKGFYRLRISKDLRLIFKPDLPNETVYIYALGWRKDIYR